VGGERDVGVRPRVLRRLGPPLRGPAPRRVPGPAHPSRPDQPGRPACPAHRPRPAPPHRGAAAPRRGAVAVLVWFDQLPDSARAEVAAPLLNKLRAILLHPFAAQLLCGPTTVDLARLLDTGGLLLVRLPRGVLGEDTVRLIGSPLVAQCGRPHCAAHNSPSTTGGTPRCCSTIATTSCTCPTASRTCSPKPEGFGSRSPGPSAPRPAHPALRDGIATDARNKILLAVSPDDAAHLSRHTLPELGAHDLAHLDGFHAAARLTPGTSEARAFILTIRPPAGQPPRLPHAQPPRPAPERQQPQRKRRGY